jgi:hypothetical protein
MEDEQPVEPGEIKREGANVTIGAPIAVAISTSPLNDEQPKPDAKED